MPHAKKTAPPKSESPSKSGAGPNEMSRHTCELVRRLLKTERFSGWGGQARLGEALGVTPARISKLSSQGGGVSIDFARRVADLAGVDSSTLVPADTMAAPTIPPPKRHSPANGIMVARTVPALPGVQRLQNLELAIGYHKDENRWSPAAIAAARIHDGKDLPPQQWAKLLDKLEKAITAAFGEN